MYFKYFRPTGHDPILGQAKSPDCIRVLAFYDKNKRNRAVLDLRSNIFSKFTWYCVESISRMYFEYTRTTGNEHSAKTPLLDGTRVLQFIVKKARKKVCCRLETKFFLQTHIGSYEKNSLDAYCVPSAHRKRSYTVNHFHSKTTRSHSMIC